MPAPRRTRARAEAAPPGFETADRLLQQAENHLASAAIAGVDPEGRFGLLYDAARVAQQHVEALSGR